MPGDSAAPVPRTHAAVILCTAAVLLAAVAACAAAFSPAALAGETVPRQAPAQAVPVVIDSVSPQVARPGGTVTVTGTVTNRSGSPLSSLSVQLQSSATPFTSRDDLASYSRGTLDAGAPVGSPVPLSGSLARGATARWQVSVPVAAIGMSGFGVYPLAAEAVDAIGMPVGTERTFLPFWPGPAASASVHPLKIAWIWPLIAPPQKGMCTALASNGLAASVAPGGRLDTLLTAGAQHSARDSLTWAVDPGLLSGVATMTRPYQVGGTADCTGRTAHRASTAAAKWLATLRSATSGQQMLVTPYDDVDVAALTHQGLDNDLGSAYRQGRSAAAALLGRPAAGTPGGRAAASRPQAIPAGQIAWPAGGLADASVLGNLAVNGISTVVLSTSEMPPAATSGYTPDDAVTRTPTSAGTQMNVLLADRTLTSLLGSASTAPGSSFAVSQRFLAETAMIVAEGPGVSRSAVVAPPREWNPSPALAGRLLTETTSAPWLRPATLSGLAASAASARTPRRHPPDEQVSPRELPHSYLVQVTALDNNLRLYTSMLAKPQAGYLARLAQGVAATESSAWRGGGAARQQGLAMLGRVAGYVSAAVGQVGIIHSARATLVGSSGPVPVSISNGLPEAIQVRLAATAPPDSRLSVTGYQRLITVGPGQTQTVRISIRSGAVGDRSVQLRLLARDGRPLPGDTVPLSVQSTQFGSDLLVIIYAAIGILVLTAVARAVRRGLRDGGPAPGASPPADREQDQDTAVRSASMSSPAGRAATVGRDSDATDPRHSPEAPDDFAEARGWARYP